MALTMSVAEIVEKSNSPLLKIHPSWERILLGDVAEVLNGFAFKSENFNKDNGFPLLRIRDVKSGTTETFYDGSYDPSYIVNPGELVIGMDGDFNSARWKGEPALLNQRVCKVTVTSPNYLPEFLDYVLPGYLKAINEKTSSVTVKHLSSNTVKEIPLPFPPRPEQERIVAKLEETFTQLEAGVAELQSAKAQLKRYRASVLKSAVEGVLTREWREAHQGQIEPAEKLLARILEDRRKKWEEEGGKGKYKEPAAPEVDGLPELPDGWTWATLPQLGELNRGKSKHRPRNAPELYGGSYPFVQTGDVRHANGIIREYSQTYSEEGLAQSRLWPAGTLCITIAANIADTAILGFDACFPDSVVGFLCDPNHCNVKYVELFLRTAKQDLERYAPATAQKNINLRILSELAIPLPSLKEQNMFVDKVERRLSVADESEKELNESLVRAERLRGSILKNAFEGKL